MKTGHIIAALLTALTATAGPVYNIHTHTERSRPPIKANVLPQQREGQAEGWREIIPFAAPEGMVKVAGTRTLADTNTAPREVYQTITQAEHDASVAAAAQAEHDAEAPSGDLATWSKREKCLLLVTFKLAKEHWPSMTQQQFLDNVKAEWDAVQ